MASNNSGQAGFEDWWNDPFVQQIVREGIKNCGLESSNVLDIFNNAANGWTNLIRAMGLGLLFGDYCPRLYDIKENQLNLTPDRQ